MKLFRPSNIAPQPAEFYHMQDFPRGHPDFIMSYSELTRFWKNPRKWVANGYQQEASKAMLLGDLIDCIVTEPQSFEGRFQHAPKTYVSKRNKCPGCGSESDAKKCSKCKVERVMTDVELPWSTRSDTCKAIIAEMDAKGIRLVGPEEMQEAFAAKDSLLGNGAIRRFFEDSSLQVRLSYIYDDSQTGLSVPMRSKLDAVPGEGSDFDDGIGDLKTTWDASPRAWKRAIFDRDYHMQAALYLDAWNAINKKRVYFYNHVVETEPPYIAEPLIMSEEFLEIGRCKYMRALQLYCRCLKTGEWPSYYDREANPVKWRGHNIVDPEEWMSKSMDA